jgi:hypothetical protein
VAGLIAATGLAATASGAPISVSSANWDLVIPQRGFEQKLYYDCLSSSRYGFSEFTTPSPAGHVFEGVGIPTLGSFDPATRTGALTIKTPAFRVDNTFAHSGAIIVGWFGLKTVGAGAIVTGRIQRTRTIFARLGPRRPLLRIKRLGFAMGTFQHRGKVVPDTFEIGMSGRATILPALAREVTRIRCRGPHIVTSRPIRAGSAFGTVQLQLLPDAATGLGGTFDIKNLKVAADNENDLTPAITPTSLHTDLPAGLRTQLRCEAAHNCTPQPGTQFTLAGGFTITLGDRSVTVTNLSVAYEDANGVASPVVSGTVDGTPMAVLDRDGGSQAFLDHATTALNAYRVDLSASTVAAHFTETAPP